MRNDTLTVDEGVEDNTQICVTLNITGGGTVECQLTAVLDTIEGSAGRSTFHVSAF